MSVGLYAFFGIGERWVLNIFNAMMQCPKVRDDTILKINHINNLYVLVRHNISEHYRLAAMAAAENGRNVRVLLGC